MKKSCKISLIAILLIIVGVGIAAVATCPKADEHMKVLNAKTKAYLNQKYPTPEGHAIPNLKFLVAGKLIEVYYDEHLTVKNSLFFNQAVLATKDGDIKVSTGAFGKIFLSDEMTENVVETIQADKSVFRETDEHGRLIKPDGTTIKAKETKKELNKDLQLK